MLKFLLAVIIMGCCAFCAAQTDSLEKNRLFFAKFDSKNQLGVSIAVGKSTFKPSFSNWQQGNINYNDSLNGIQAIGVFKLELGFIYQIRLTKALAIRPAYHTVFEGGKLSYQRKSATETLNLSTYSHTVSMPFVFTYSRKNDQPYFFAGPAFLYRMTQEKTGRIKLPLSRYDVLAELGAGVDFYSASLKCIVSPGIKYSLGFLNAREAVNNIYGNTIETLKRRSIVFTIHFRSTVKH